MSHYSSVALLGVGSQDLGRHFVNAFVNASPRVSVTVISQRDTAQSKDWLPKDVKLVNADIRNIEQMADAFRDNSIDVVVSLLGLFAMDGQNICAEAAKAAGTVKLFVLSEWGYSVLGQTEGFMGWKEKSANHIQSIANGGGPATLRIFCGLFYSWLLPEFGFPSCDKISYLDNPDGKGTATSEEEVAEFASYIITHLAPSELENKIMFIEGDSVSARDLADIVGTTVQEVEKIPGDYEGRTKGFLTYMGRKWATGELQTHPVHNHLWKGHVWKTFKDVIDEYREKRPYNELVAE